jgi:hypothetical protein
LKEIGCKWSPNKQAWYLKPEWYRKRSRKNYELDEIRGMFGSHVFNKEQESGLVPV